MIEGSALMLYQLSQFNSAVCRSTMNNQLLRLNKLFILNEFLISRYSLIHYRIISEKIT